MITGIEHFAIASPDPKRLAEWYISHLAFQLSYEYGGNYFVRAENGVVLEIVPSEGARPPSEMRTPGLRHIALSVTDFDAAYQNLQKQGISFSAAPYNAQGNRLVFFEDADGNLLHLIHREKPLP